MLDRVQLKYEAKAITKNAKASAYVFTLIYLAIGLVLDGIDYLVSGSPQTEVYGYLADYMPEAAVYLRGTEPILHLPAPAVWFVSIVISLVTAVLGAGYILYTMNVRKGLITPYTTLFDGIPVCGQDHPAGDRAVYLRVPVVAAVHHPRHHRRIPLSLRPV